MDWAQHFRPFSVVIDDAMEDILLYLPPINNANGGAARVSNHKEACFRRWVQGLAKVRFQVPCESHITAQPASPSFLPVARNPRKPCRMLKMEDGAEMGIRRRLHIRLLPNGWTDADGHSWVIVDRGSDRSRCDVQLWTTDERSGNC